jgi:Tol biopolymer transport system component
MKHTMFFCIAFLCIFALFVEHGHGGAPSQPKIAFTSQGDIWLIAPDGKDLVNLTQTPNFADAEPVWSPDGRYIDFTSARDGNSEIYRMDADGKNPVNLTRHPAMDRWPSVSPDGKQLCFRSDREPFGLFVMDADGSNVRHLINFGGRSSWSPDGKRIAFEGRATRKDIYVIDVDGKNLTNLTQDGVGNYAPAWSPDGNQIAYGSWRDWAAGEIANVEEIYVMNADGSAKRRLTRAPGLDDLPAWSPDGKQIVFRSDRDGGARLYIMNADGTRQRALTPLGMSGFEPSWFDPAFVPSRAVKPLGKMWTLWGLLKL